MKAALLISGYLRSFELNIENLIEKIISKFDICDVYIHVTLNEQKEDKYLNTYDTEQIIKKIKESLNPKCMIIENNLNLDDDLQKNNILNSWSKFYKLNEIKKINENIFGKYDLVIKTRPDINFLTEIDFNKFITKKIYLPKDTKIDKTKLLNNTDKYVCDIFAFGNSKTMDKYFLNVKNLKNLIKKYGNISETITYHHLNNNKIDYELIDIDYIVLLSRCNIFAICGDSATGKSTLATIIKKFFSNSFLLEGDRYHKWERGNEKWQNYTHLNPDANFIAKMNEDIFDLKIGKSIYQVDYDHKNGKFTEKELIEPTENIIVCGLHSLYVDDSNLYDLKIFMDTEEKLKHKWKIERDTTKRGYSIEKILNQIESRKEDYKKYIEPQKDISDIVVKFFENKNNISLNIAIKKHFKLEKIFYELNKNKIDFSFEVNNSFNNFIFEKHQENNLFDNKLIKLNNYYEYIMFFILNIGK